MSVPHSHLPFLKYNNSFSKILGNPLQHHSLSSKYLKPINVLFEENDSQRIVYCSKETSSDENSSQENAQGDTQDSMENVITRSKSSDHLPLGGSQVGMKRVSSTGSHLSTKGKRAKTPTSSPLTVPNRPKASTNSEFKGNPSGMIYFDDWVVKSKKNKDGESLSVESKKWNQCMNQMLDLWDSLLDRLKSAYPQMDEMKSSSGSEDANGSTYNPQPLQPVEEAYILQTICHLAKRREYLLDMGIVDFDDCYFQPEKSGSTSRDVVMSHSSKNDHTRTSSTFKTLSAFLKDGVHLLSTIDSHNGNSQTFPISSRKFKKSVISRYTSLLFESFVFSVYFIYARKQYAEEHPQSFDEESASGSFVYEQREKFIASIFAVSAFRIFPKDNFSSLVDHICHLTLRRRQQFARCASTSSLSSMGDSHRSKRRHRHHHHHHHKSKRDSKKDQKNDAKKESCKRDTRRDSKRDLTRNSIEKLITKRLVENGALPIQNPKDSKKKRSKRHQKPVQQTTPPQQQQKHTPNGHKNVTEPATAILPSASIETPDIDQPHTKHPMRAQSHSDLSELSRDFSENPIRRSKLPRDVKHVITNNLPCFKKHHAHHDDHTEVLPLISLSPPQQMLLTSLVSRILDFNFCTCLHSHVPSSSFFYSFLKSFSDEIDGLGLKHDCVRRYLNLMRVFAALGIEVPECSTSNVVQQSKQWSHLATQLLTNPFVLNLLLDIQLSKTNAYQVNQVFHSLDLCEKWIQRVGKKFAALRSELIIKAVDACLSTNHFRISSKALVFVYNIHDYLHPEVRQTLAEYLLREWGLELMCHWHDDVRICLLRLVVYKMLWKPEDVYHTRRRESMVIGEKIENDDPLSEKEDRVNVSLKSKAETYIHILRLYDEKILKTEDEADENGMHPREADIPHHFRLSNKQKPYVEKCMRDLNTIQKEYHKWKQGVYMTYRRRWVEKLNAAGGASPYLRVPEIPYPIIRIPNFSLKNV